MNWKQQQYDDEIEREAILERRFSDPTEKKQFRNAYYFKAGNYDYSSLAPYCENLVMATEGYGEHVDVTRRKLRNALAEYDSDKDLIVLAGRVIDHLFAGQIIYEKVLAKPKHKQSYAIAIFYNGSYHFYMVALDPGIETYEIVTRQNY